MLKGFHTFSELLKWFGTFPELLKGFYKFPELLKGFGTFPELRKGFYKFPELLKGFGTFPELRKGFYTCIPCGGGGGCAAEVQLEAQLLLGSGQGSAGLLSLGMIKQATVIVQRESKDDQPLPGVVTPLLAYRRVDDFDPKPPTEHLDHLGLVLDYC